MSQLESLLQQCTVKLTLPGRMGWGTGLFVAPGLILTCAHVVQEAKGQPVQVRWQNQENWATAIVERSLSNPYDLALLRVTLSADVKPPCVYLDEEFSAGHALYAYGYSDEFPEGASLLGECEGDATENNSRLILFKATRVRSGMSGSPLLNLQTKAICGIVKFTRDRSFDLGGGAIPTRVILEQFPELWELQRQFHESDRCWSDQMTAMAEFKVLSTLIELQSVDDLVQQVRSRLHDDIQRLHGTMPLWGVDHWVPLGDLFVDVNILEELSSSRKLELDDLWQDFSQNPSYRSLDRMGLGKERQRVSGLEVLAKNTNLMVVGKPGSGKTTYLQRVVTECNAGKLQAHRIPVLIKLREFVEDGRSLSYSLERYLEECWQLSATETQLVLSQDRVLVLLDGLDEVTGEDGTTITKKIKQFARAYPQVQLVVTCRTQSQESRFERFDYVEVADFNEPQVRAFAEHWFQTLCADRVAGQAKAKVFLDQLFRKENKPIRELAITPILLSLTCAVFQQKQAFYSKRSKLYEEGLELLLEKWDERRGIERDEIYRDLSVERKLELLSYLAVKKFEQEQYVLFEQAELEGYIEEFLQIGLRESRGVLRAIASQHGLLIERATRVWSFSHLTFQEYLVAKWFCKHPQLLTNLIKFAKYDKGNQWRETFLLTVEIVEDASCLLIMLKSYIDSDIASSDILQDFLDWVYQKSNSVQVSYQSAAIRFFYFYLSQAIPFIISSGLPNERYGNLNHELLIDLKLSYIWKEKVDFDHDSIKIIDKNLGLDVEGSLAELNDLDYNLFRKEDFCLKYIILLEDVVQITQDGLLKKKLEDLFEQIPNHLKKDRGALEAWWRNNREVCRETLKRILEEQRNIKLDWYFDDEQRSLIWQYYDANKLLLDCFEASYFISYEVRKEIEETLILSIAQIEKRKHEKLNE